MGKSEAKSRNAPRSQSGGKCVAPHKVHAGSRSVSRKGIFRIVIFADPICPARNDLKMIEQARSHRHRNWVKANFG